MGLIGFFVIFSAAKAGPITAVEIWEPPVNYGVIAKLAPKLLASTWGKPLALLLN
jgi:hypothetical protein